MKKILAGLVTVLTFGTYHLGAQFQPRLTPPSYSTLPANCNIGDIVTKTGSDAGHYVCYASNAWNVVEPILQVSPVATIGVTITGATETTSQPLLSATQTWNAGGVAFVGEKLNITNTASSSLSQLAAWQVGSADKAWIRVDGTVFTKNGFLIDTGGGYAGFLNQFGNEIGFFSAGNNANLFVMSNTVVEQRDGANAQRFSFYNTWTNFIEYERFDVDWTTTTNVLSLSTQKGGSGTARVLQLSYGGTTTSAISIPITSGDITFGGIVFPTGYKSSDGSPGISGATCSAWKNGLCTSA